MKKVINISNCESWKDVYQIWGEEIAKNYPEYQVTVDGGSFRGYDVLLEVNLESKTIKLDYYLPMYISSKETQSWVVKEIGDYIEYGYDKGFKSKEQHQKVRECLSNVLTVGWFDDVKHLVYDERGKKIVLSFNYNSHKQYRQPDLVGTVELYANGTVVKKSKSKSKRYLKVVNLLQQQLKDGVYDFVFNGEAA